MRLQQHLGGAGHATAITATIQRASRPPIAPPSLTTHSPLPATAYSPLPATAYSPLTATAFSPLATSKGPTATTCV